MIEILIYHNISLLDQVIIFPFTEGMTNLSLVISFSIISLLPSLATLSIVTFTVVHFGPLILETA